MPQLLLLRHAKSSWDDRGITDHARPLNPRGRAAAAAMRTAMEQSGLVPDLILVSTAQRTRETAAALEPWAETPLIDFVDNLYLAPASTMVSLIREVPDTVRSLMLIGHNPGLHELALLLSDHGAAGPTTNEHARRLAEAYPSGALAEFFLPTPWSTLKPGTARLHRFICPRDLPA